MKRAVAWLLVADLGLGTAVALTAPWPIAAAIAALAFVALGRGRAGFLAFAASTLLLGTLVLAFASPGSDLAAFGPIRLSRVGAAAGLAGAVRLVALLGINLAVLSWVSAVRILDALTLPPRPTAVLAAILIAAHDVGGDIRRLTTAVRLDGIAHEGAVGRAKRAAGWMPALLLASLRRAQTRRDALQLAGHRMPAGFVPVIAVSALATASRLALAPLPNLKATYLIVFLGGLLFGTRVGVLAALVAMATSDLILSGLLPESFVNVPAMAALGALGGLLGRVDFAGESAKARLAGALLAGSVGVAATLLFSVLADAATWLLVLDYRAAGVSGLKGLVVFGLAFNAIPAAFNGLLFALAVGPTQRTLRQIGASPLPGRRPGPAPPLLDRASATAATAAPPLK